MEAQNFQDEAPLEIPIDSYKDHYVQVFDLIPMQNPIGKSHCPDLVGEPIRLELKFTFPLKHVTELIVLGNEGLWMQLTCFVFLEGKSERDKVSLQQLLNHIQLLKYRYFGSFLSDFVSILDKDTFAFVNNNPAKCRVANEYWMQTPKLFSEDFLDRKM